MTQPQPSARGRRPWLAPITLAFFLLVPVVEIWLLVLVGQQIGALPTIAILIAQAFLGGWLMRREGAKAWQALNASVASGELPGGALLDAVLVMVGGVLVMLPGFFTDLFGLIFLLPFTRGFARRLMQVVIARRVARSGLNIDVIRAQTQPGTVIRAKPCPTSPPAPTRPTRPGVPRPTRT